jgi:predicted flavoprotein YhiN
MKPNISIVGGGPAGLMAAYILSKNKFCVTVFDRKPTVGRKFLLAGTWRFKYYTF